MANIRIYRTYRFMDKDPIIDAVRVMLETEGLLKNRKTIHKISGVSQATFSNWFEGPTKRPQYATISAVATSLGYSVGILKERQIDVKVELRKAAEFERNQLAKKKNAEVRAAARRKSKRDANRATYTEGTPA